MLSSQTRFELMLDSAFYLSNCLKDMCHEKGLLDHVEFIRASCETEIWEEWVYQDDPGSWPTRTLTKRLFALVFKTFCNLPSDIQAPLFASKFMLLMPDHEVRNSIHKLALTQISERDLFVAAVGFEMCKWPRKPGAVPNTFVEKLLRAKLVNTRVTGLGLLPYTTFSEKKKLEEVINAGKSRSTLLQVKCQVQLERLAYSYFSNKRKSGLRNRSLWQTARDWISSIIGKNKLDREYRKQFRRCLRDLDNLLEN